jgi:hypothetical protein
VRSTRLAIILLTFVSVGCTLSGTASAPVYVCAAQNAAGASITCSAPTESYKGDGCRCAIPATAGRGPDVYYGRVVTQ